MDFRAGQFFSERDYILYASQQNNGRKVGYKMGCLL